MNSLVQRLGEHILRSRQYAAAIALVAAFLSFFNLPMVNLVSAIIIGLVTLQKGYKEGLLVMLWAILPAVAMLYLGHYAVFINIVGLNYLVVMAFALFLRWNRSWVNLLQLSAFVGMVAVVLLHYLMPNLPQWLTGQLTPLLADYKSTFASFSTVDVNKLLKYFGYFTPGLLVLGNLSVNITCLFVARWWQSNIHPGAAIYKEFYAMRMPYSYSLLLILIAACIPFNGLVFANLFIVALLPLVISGLSLFHAYTATKKNGTVALLVFYLLFLFLSPYFMILLTLVGCIDSLFDLRRKFILEDAVKE